MKKIETEKERFIRIARENECDETGEAFMKGLKNALDKKPTTQEKIKKQAKKNK